MARTATVNPKRKKTNRKKKRSTSGSAKRRKTNPARRSSRGKKRAAPRRRTSGSASRKPRRRRNPARRNPRDIMDFQYSMDMLPAATLGVVGARWAVQQAGEFEGGQPGIPHAIWLYLMSRIGGNMVGNVFGDESRGDAFEIAALGFAGDLFLRYNFFTEPDSWYQRNVFLGDGGRRGKGRSPYGRMMSGVGNGRTQYTDARGRRYVRTPHGWRLAGTGNNKQLPPGGTRQTAAGLSGFSMRSQLGGFSMRSQLGSGGAIQAGRGYGSGNAAATDPIQRIYGGSEFG
ncbi:MAG: hypothetical protein ACOCUS_04240 [Polyangiales bacterium]